MYTCFHIITETYRLGQTFYGFICSNRILLFHFVLMIFISLHFLVRTVFSTWKYMLDIIIVKQNSDTAVRDKHWAHHSFTDILARCGFCKMTKPYSFLTVIAFFNYRRILREMITSSLPLLRYRSVMYIYRLSKLRMRYVLRWLARNHSD